MGLTLAQPLPVQKLCNLHNRVLRNLEHGACVCECVHACVHEYKQFGTLSVDFVCTICTFMGHMNHKK